MTTWQIIITVLSIASLVGGFLKWHFSSIDKLKDEIQALELRFKDLEHKDELQQMTLNKLDEIFPMVYTFLIKKNSHDNN